MSRIRPEEVREIALLARLELSDQEIERMTADLDAILGYVDALKELGFYGGAVDGSFGPATQEAVNNIQTHYSISDGGVVGAETWHLINMAATKDQTSLEHNWSGSEINTVDVPEMTDPEAQS